MTVADLFVEELRARDVQFVATLNGHGLDPFYLACQRAGMRMIDVRNEQSASYMAEVTGRLTRTVGVCAVSGAVAHANALSGVVNAWFDGAPMLLITGTTPLVDIGWGNFQDFNPVPIAAPICKYSRMIDAPERVSQIVHEAFTAATSGRPGPVHLSLPMDVASTEVDRSRIPRSRVRSGTVRISGQAEPEQLQQVAALLKDAKRPLLVAGSGVYYSRGEDALSRLIAQQLIPTVIPIWDRGCIPQPHESFLGVLGAASGGPRLLPDADLILMVGAEFDYRLGQISPPAIREDARIVRIHSDISRLRQGLEADISIQGSPATVLDQLTQVCRQEQIAPSRQWLSEAQSRRTAHVQSRKEVAARLPDGMNGIDVVNTLKEVITHETVVLIDGGNIGQWFHQLSTDHYPGHWVTCGASGVVGWGLGGALAARAVYPDRPVILLAGDGSFTFTVSELECAARQGLPFVAVVADDRQWGITVTGQTQNHGSPLYSMLGPTRLDRVAEGFGCKGVYVEKQDQLLPALRTALEEDRPTVIQVPIVPGSPAD